VLTVQEEDRHDCLDPVRARIRANRGSLRKSGADYLGYVILDAIVDGFYPVLEVLGDRLEDLELHASEVRRGVSHDIHIMKRSLLMARRSVWPIRDVVNALLRDDSPHIAESTRPFLRDTYDHTVQAMDMVETFREISSGLMDLYLSGVSNRTNEIMKVLTIISTMFIPLTFIAGVYGMNFDTKVSPYNMPELESPYGYPLTIAAMVACVLALAYFYRRKGWLGGS
jgi:magnesium transporter